MSDMPDVSTVAFGYGEALYTGISIERVIALWEDAMSRCKFFRLSAEGVIYYVNPRMVVYMEGER